MSVGQFVFWWGLLTSTSPGEVELPKAEVSLRAPMKASQLYGRPPPERGMGLGLFSADSTYRYRSLVDEIVETRSTHLSLVWVWWQADWQANEIRAVDGWSATDEQILDTIQYARQRGLHVTAFPIVRLMKSRRDQWRGKIAPVHEDAWWESYQAYILAAARLARKGGAQRLCVGSELLSREAMRARWKELIERVRVDSPELELLYSANWDHFDPVSFWDLVDVVGLTGYWELTRDMDASVSDLLVAWQSVKPSVKVFSERLGRPVVITEIGYPSLDGGAAWPWDETRKAPVDQIEQARAYEAFARSWSDTPWLAGVYWWNWFGFGGPKDTNYTPRMKPAADVIRRWYQQADPKP